MIEEARKFSKQLKTLYRELKHLESTIGGALWARLDESKGSIFNGSLLWPCLGTVTWAIELRTESGPSRVRHLEAAHPMLRTPPIPLLMLSFGLHVPSKRSWMLLHTSRETPQQPHSTCDV